MRKALSIFFVVFALILLAGCGEKEYPVDGEYLAYELSVSRNAPQVISVTVQITNGEVKDYFIDTRQGTRTGEGTEASPYVWAWNTQTKKELGFNYGMKANSEIEKEWFEQAEAIEAFWLENGVEAMTVDADGYIDNVTGASVRDSYSAVALKALENAKAGKFVSIYSSGTDLYSAEMMLTPKGEIESLVLDVRQSTRSQADGSFTWNQKTKQELGDDYGMKGVGGGYTYANGAWTASGTASLEWYEQVQLITDYIEANGWSNSLQPIADRGGSLNGTDLLSDLAGATIRTGGYYTVLKTLFNFAGDAVK
jgi:hypothetical protein